jgi:ComF family protein
VPFLDALFPRRCLGCGQTGSYICSSCLPLIKKVTQLCPVCERPSLFGQTHPGCDSRFSLTGLISLFAYEGVIRKAIHQLKYRQVTDLINEFWQIVSQELSGRAEELSSFQQFLKKRPTVIPIPLFWYKENLRGFNQSSLIAKRMAERYNLAFLDNFLIRRRMTATQTKLNPKERQKNVKDAFVINSHFSLPTTNFLLIDDVWTTGATLKTAGKVLRRAGVKRVWGLTIAR